jgi:hypothetical protein
MRARSDQAARAAIGAAAHEVRLPTIRAEASRLAEIAARERQSYLVFLAEVLAAEVDDRGDTPPRPAHRRSSLARLKRLLAGAGWGRRRRGRPAGYRWRAAELHNRTTGMYDRPDERTSYRWPAGHQDQERPAHESSPNGRCCPSISRRWGPGWASG